MSEFILKNDHGYDVRSVGCVPGFEQVGSIPRDKAEKLNTFVTNFATEQLKAIEKELGDGFTLKRKKQCGIFTCLSNTNPLFQFSAAKMYKENKNNPDFSQKYGGIVDEYTRGVTDLMKAFGIYIGELNVNEKKELLTESRSENIVNIVIQEVGESKFNSIIDKSKNTDALKTQFLVMMENVPNEKLENRQ